MIAATESNVETLSMYLWCINVRFFPSSLRVCYHWLFDSQFFKYRKKNENLHKNRNSIYMFNVLTLCRSRQMVLADTGDHQIEITKRPVQTRSLGWVDTNLFKKRVSCFFLLFAILLSPCSFSLPGWNVISNQFYDIAQNGTGARGVQC